MTKTRLFIIILAIVLVVLFLALIIINKQKNSAPTPIIPGQSQVLPIFITATPFLTKSSGNIAEYYVGSPESSNYTVYVATDDNLNFFIQKDPKTFSYPTLHGYAAQYGQANEVRYGPWYVESGYESYVFHQPGLVIIAHPSSRAITEVWHLEPNLTSTTFNSKYSRYFSITPPPRYIQM